MAKSKKKQEPRQENQIQVGDGPNLDTLELAASEDAVMLVRAKEKATGEYRTLLCAINRAENGDFLPTPLAVMIWGNPFELFDDPMTEEGE